MFLFSFCTYIFVILLAGLNLPQGCKCSKFYWNVCRFLTECIASHWRIQHFIVTAMSTSVAMFVYYKETVHHSLVCSAQWRALLPWIISVRICLLHIHCTLLQTSYCMHLVHFVLLSSYFFLASGVALRWHREWVTYCMEPLPASCWVVQHS
jgi:hypothetical protein